MNKDSKIYIAGHLGLVGSALVRELKQLGYNNLVYRTSKELDLRRQAQVEDFFSQEKPEYVFLAAGKVGGILANNAYKADFIYDNVMIAANIINAAYKFKVKKLLNLGSSCIYPKLAAQPIKEEYLLNGYLEETNEAYAIAKIMTIKLCRYYNEQYTTNFISVMPTNLYGIGDNFNLETAHVLPALIRKFYLAKLLSENDYPQIENNISAYPLGFNLNSKDLLISKYELEGVLNNLGIFKNKVVLWGTGNPYREFLYVNDLAKACMFLMNNYDYQAIGEAINVGMGQDLQIKDLVDIIKKIAGFKGEVIWDSSKPDGTPRKFLDSSKIRSLGWQPMINIEEGIKIVYTWLSQKKENRQEPILNNSIY